MWRALPCDSMEHGERKMEAEVGSTRVRQLQGAAPNGDADGPSPAGESGRDRGRGGRGEGRGGRGRVSPTAPAT